MQSPKGERSRGVGAFGSDPEYTSERTNNAAGIAGGEDVLRNRPRHDAACADHGPVADSDARANDGPAAHPDIGPDCDGLSQFQPVRRSAALRGCVAV